MRRPWTKWKSAAVIAGTALFLTGYWAGREFRFADQVQLLRELREVSTIIFGIMGAWLAIVYPEELKQKLRPTEILRLDRERLEKFSAIMRCLVSSAVIVCVVLAMQFAAPLAARAVGSQGMVNVLRGIGFGVGLFLAGLQIWLLLSMLAQLNEADADVRAIKEAQARLKEGPQGMVGTKRML